VGEDSLSGFGPITLLKRPVRSRMRGVVGAGGEKPPATRFIDLSAVKVDWQKKRIFFHHKVLFLEKFTAGNAFQQ